MINPPPSPRQPRHPAARAAVHPARTHQAMEQSLLALVVVALGSVIFQAVYRSSDDLVMAALAPVIAFLSVGSLFAGHGGRH
ncbi:hypothetical protein [Novosphingobium terrae]|uniref:hypothetical protein n=1 Tax=Novosphingobium terrae TaxID=2726189 RepID=UPI00197D3D3A|nr:hypothetical protein [Novosphingobium terrae]